MSPAQETIRNLFVISLLLPLVSSAIIVLFTRRVLYKAAGWLALGMMAVSFLCAVTVLIKWMGLPHLPHTAETPFTWNIPWIPIPGTQAGWLYLGVMVDGLTVAMMVMVTGISTLVHLYSVGYMEGDKRYNLFFAYLSLFTFSMLGIVLANSIMMLFVFWELVGLTSYLLIGFWFEKRGPQLACKKAFVMNRIGDMGFLIGFGILFYKLGGNVLLPVHGGMFEAIKTQLEAQGFSVTNPPMWLTAAGIGLFFGAIGKSAQFPLHTWLPDAMEGPTPVSSIVHSATMVAAGVYLTGRIYPILTPGAHLFISTIGLITLTMAACMALVMTDIKRVLAYSTLSQLGYMILGLGTGSYVFALFHLFTHAFFKCCLFQCSGSVIRAAHHQQDMRYYGGLWKKMPITTACYGVCMLAIAGASFPRSEWGMSGFYSKDGIIAGAVNYGDAMGAVLGHWAKIYFWLPTGVAYLTVFYMARSFALTFLGRPRDQHLYDHAQEAPWQMTVPQVILAIMAFVSAPWGSTLYMPHWQHLIDSTRDTMVRAGVTWVQPGEVEQFGHGLDYVHRWLFLGFGWIIVLILGILIYRPGMKLSSKVAAIPGVNLLYTWVLNKFYFDALYDIFAVSVCKAVSLLAAAFDKWIIDGLVNLAGLTGRVSAWAVGIFDNRVVDGAVNGAAYAARNGGGFLCSTQPGRVRAYVLLLFATATVASLVVVVVAIVSR